jgi:hypothetical protein
VDIGASMEDDREISSPLLLSGIREDEPACLGSLQKQLTTIRLDPRQGLAAALGSIRSRFCHLMLLKRDSVGLLL